MTNQIIQTKKFPRVIIFLFFIQLFFFIINFANNKEKDFSIFYILMPITLLLSTAYLKIEINDKSINYKLFPIHLKSKVIEWNSINKLKVIKIDALSDFLGWGFRYSSKYGWGYIFDSNYALFITLNSGKKITMTIDNKDEIIKFFVENNIPFQNEI